MSDFNEESPATSLPDESRRATFHTQSAILERYAHQSDPRADAVALRVVLDILRQKSDLRRRFFELRPDVAWLDVLWEEGFFLNLPTLESLVNEHGWYRFWDVQEFLITHAAARPAYVLAHVEHLQSVQADSLFLNAGLRAVEKLLPEHSEAFAQGFSIVLGWLENIQFTAALAYTALEVIETCLEHQHHAAFPILSALVKPHPNPNAQPLSDNSIINAEAIGALDSTTRYRLENAEEKRQIFTRLRQLDFEALREVWESRLLESLSIEAKTRGYDDETVGDSTWWRSAIEDSEQDNGFDHKDLLLVSLRDTLEDQAGENIETLRPHVARYLAHPRQILRRLGLHLLRTYPHHFPDWVEEKLLEAPNYQDVGLHHEFFGLLADGFPVLNATAQRQVLDIIERGPSDKYLDDSVEWGLSVRQISPEELRQIYLEAWQRDRMWMIRAHLPAAEKSRLDDIVSRLKEPDHPAYTSYSTGAGFVASISPVSREDLAQMTPSQLWQYLEAWQPSPRQSFDFTDINWEGLAKEVAETLREDLPRYAPSLLAFFKLRPYMALALVNITLALEKPEEAAAPPRQGTFRGTGRGKRRRRILRSLPEPITIETAPVAPVETPAEETQSAVEAIVCQVPEEARRSLTPSLSIRELWELRLQLVEGILSDPTLSVDVTHNFDGGWPSVRRNLVSLLKDGLSARDERQIPDDFLPRVRDALLAFCEDPDPDFGSDRPQEGWLGHNDPLTVSLNHVRPEALGTLEVYASARSRRGLDGHPIMGVGPARLEPEIAAKLSAHLDRNFDASRAVRSIYGRYLGGLYWLDKPWVEAHLDTIFPWAEDDESRWYFAAAWDAFIVSNGDVYLSLFDAMRPTYARAVEAMAAGFISDTHLQLAQSFAGHLFVEFFNRPYDLKSPAGANNLLRLFMENATPHQRGQAIWTLWRMAANHKEWEESKEQTDGEAPEMASITFAQIWEKAREFWQWRVDESSQHGYPADFDEEMQWFCFLARIAPETETIQSLYPLLCQMLQHLGRKEGRLNGWDDLEEFVADEVEADPVTAIRFYSEMHAQIRPGWIDEEKTRFILKAGAENLASRRQTLALLDLLARRGDRRYEDIYQQWVNVVT